MIEAIYIIGSAFSLLLLVGKVRDLRQQLRQVTWERDSYAQLIQAPLSRDGRALPAAARAWYPEGTEE
jgi:hypothetical protein